MILSRKILKKAPLPYRVPQLNRCWYDYPDHKLCDKTLEIIKNSFVKIFGERINLSTKEHKSWGEFLSQRGIYWDIYVSKKYDWPDWEYSANKMIPKNLENHLNIGYYYVPEDLIMKILVLGELL